MVRLLAVAALCCSLAAAQSLRPAEGIRSNTPSVHALTGLTIVPSPGKRVEKGTIVIRDGVIIAAGTGVTVPADARVRDCRGLTAYAGLIDLASEYGMPKPKSGTPPEPKRGAASWNPNVAADRSAADEFLPDRESAEKYRAQGFTTVAALPSSGIFKGRSALVNLGEGTANAQVVRKELFQHVALQGAPADGYPGSLMGRIALVRQTFSDAQWYAAAMKRYAARPDQRRPEEDRTLAALDAAAAGRQTVVFETGDELNALRAAAVAKEFGLTAVLRGSGYEYRRPEALKSAALPVIVPVNFPEPPSLGTPEEIFNAGYEELRHWDFAPENPSRLRAAGITVALTAAQLKDIAKFRSMVTLAVEAGLDPADALAALTTVPASLAGMEKQLGTVESGKIANLVLTEGDLFSNAGIVRETWVDGVRYEVKAPPPDLRGTWSFTLRTGARTDTGRLVISGGREEPAVQFRSGTLTVKATGISLSSRIFSFALPGDSLGHRGTLRFSGPADSLSVKGLAAVPGGADADWRMERREPMLPKKDSASAAAPLRSALTLLAPDGAFGRTSLPPQQDLFIRGATVWTSGPQGVLEDADVLIIKGKIAKVGKGLSPTAGAVVVDGKGKHVTPGLIDAHSHTAVTGGVNEGEQAVTAEVRIGDVLNSDDINIYRQLAGGLTVANVLHGSANAIGGQNVVIKLRWGMLPEQLKFEGAPPGIKFALGENPKQSNWFDAANPRYPATRMGVEQLIRDEFTAAREYDAAVKAKPAADRVPVRRDLELEAVAEILRGERLVHSHCYRQDEILMLLRVSDDFGFTIGTLQHALEAYKVADEVAKRKVGASLFSDWWAYKAEVMDAIPYAGQLLHDAGVLVSYNSDSNEMARRMNLEAAKAVRYGGVSETDALAFVTINPARQLRIDRRVGSLEPGKDGDVVVWSGHPLSTFSVCEQTYIEGRRFFDRAEDLRMRADIAAAKAELVQKALRAPKRGSGASTPMPQRSSVYSCHEEHGADTAAEQEGR